MLWFLFKLLLPGKRLTVQSSRLKFKCKLFLKNFYFIFIIIIIIFIKCINISCNDCILCNGNWFKMLFSQIRLKLDLAVLEVKTHGASS